MTDAPLELVQFSDAWGRPVWLRLSAVALVEGARDAGDRYGDLLDRHPTRPYHRLTLTCGARVYLAADDPRLSLLGI